MIDATRLSMITQPTQDTPMTRELTDHIVNPANDKLKITVEDAPGAGGACHLYSIRGFDPGSNLSAKSQHFLGGGDIIDSVSLLFQNGPIAEVGVNGVTHEALIAILIDRLRCFQAGPYACEENGTALFHLLNAQASLHSRTLARMSRGVEGTHQK
jgi:hypothetical protein